MDTITLLIIIGAALLLFIILMYNSLVSKRNSVNSAFSSIDIYLKKRYDLIPNLVETVKQYMQHEKNTLEEIVRLRNSALSGNITNDEKAAINNQITKSIGSIYLAVENYPDLKASENFKKLQASMNEVEEQISAARRAYNAAVLALNNSVQMFPSSIIASIFGVKAAQMIEIESHEKVNPNLKNLF